MNGGAPRPRVFLGIAVLTALLAGAVAIWITVKLSDYVDNPFELSIFPALFLAYDRLPLLLIAAVSGLLLVIPLRVLAGCAPPAKWLKFFADQPLILPAVACVLLCIGTNFVYHDHPLSADEFAAVFQAKVFASGHLFGHFPPSLVSRLIYPSFVNYFLLVSPVSGDVASSYWPGFSLLLTPFTAAHVAWACNPLLAAVSLWLMYLIVIQMRQDRIAAVWAMLLSIASPAFVVNAISYYSMTAHLCLNLLFVLLLLRRHWKRTVVAGLVGSFALALHNPLPHIAFALPWLVWLVFHKAGWRHVMLLGAAYIPLTVVLAGGWAVVRAQLPRGDLGPSAVVPATSPGPAATPTTLPTAEAPSLRGKVISIARGMLSIFGLPDRGVLASRVVEWAKLIVWDVPGLVALALIGLWRFRRDGRALALGASALMTLAVYLVVPFDQGHGWGDRYFHSAWGVLPILGALALSRRDEGAAVAGAMNGSVAICVIASLTILLPMRLYQVDSFIDRQLAQIPPHDPTAPSVIFINPDVGYYAEDLIQNDPFLRDPVVYMCTQGARSDAALIRDAFRGFVGRQYESGSVWTSAVADERGPAQGRLRDSK